MHRRGARRVRSALAVPNGDSIGRSKIFVNNDEWTLTDTGFSLASGTPTYVENLANWYTGGQPGNFLAYSSNFGLAGAKLKAAMAALGHTYTVSTELPHRVDRGDVHGHRRRREHQHVRDDGRGGLDAVELRGLRG